MIRTLHYPDATLGLRPEQRWGLVLTSIHMVPDGIEKAGFSSSRPFNLGFCLGAVG